MTDPNRDVRQALGVIVSDNTDVESYGGSVAHRAAGTRTVYVTAAGYEPLRSALAAAPHGDLIELIQVERSYETLQQLTAQIATDSSAIKAAGIELRSWGPDPRENKVKVGVSTDLAAAETYLHGRYGPDLITVAVDNCVFHALAAA